MAMAFYEGSMFGTRIRRPRLHLARVGSFRGSPCPSWAPLRSRGTQVEINAIYSVEGDIFWPELDFPPAEA